VTISGEVTLDALAQATPAESALGGCIDGQLVERAKAGDRRAFEQLVRRHAGTVHKRITRLVGPVPEREDLVQEVFMALLHGLGRFRGEAAFSTWLYRIVVNISFGHLRRRKRWRDRSAPLCEEDLISPRRSPEHTAAERQSLSLALRLLGQVKPKKRIAFVLRTVEGLSYEEIAEIVDARPDTVRQRVVHARRDLEKLARRELLRLRARGGSP